MIPAPRISIKIGTSPSSIQRADRASDSRGIIVIPLKKTLWEWQLRLRGKGRRFDHLRQLAEWQSLSISELDALQQQRLESLLRQAWNHIPYYHNILCQAGVVDNSGRVDVKLFKKVPLLDKAILRERFEDLKSDDLSQRRWKYNTSGGSTGEPVRFIQDQDHEDWSKAFTMLTDTWTEYDVGLPMVKLWGSERDLLVGQETLRVHLGRWLENVIWLNAFRVTPEEMIHHVSCINRVRPIQILAYVESIYELARFIEARGLEVYSPRAIVTAAGTLHQPVRQVVERVFRAPVFNRYGSREVHDIACECEVHEGLHISALTHYVEVLRPDGSPTEPGEVGEVVITPLTNFAMPLIRYRIGDMAAWSEDSCSCGRNWPLLKTVTGRVTDMFIKADGALVNGKYFTALFFFREWVKKFQIVQDKHDHLLLRVVPLDETGDVLNIRRAEVQEIEDKIRLVMGPACKVTWDQVSDIPPTASGKYRYTISKVPR